MGVVTVSSATQQPTGRRGIEFAHAARDALQPEPINPDWILEGEPKARVAWWSDGKLRVTQQYVWDCTAGRFRWHYPLDEIVHIISGEVLVEADGVPPTWLRAGDAAIFHSGTWALWEVPEYVLKHAVLRTPAIPIRLVRRLRQELTGRTSSGGLGG